VDGGSGLSGQPPDDPNWPRASDWLAGSLDIDPEADISVIGAPLRLGSISGGRFDLAPRAIREALSRYSLFAGQADLSTVLVSDAGDLAIADARPEDAVYEIAEMVRRHLDAADAIILLGGDNSVTRPGCRGIFGRELSRVGVLTFDAHHDLRDTENGLTNGNPIRALLEDGLPGENVVQVGIQPFANSEQYAAVARDAGIRVATVDDVRNKGLDAVITDALDLLAVRAEAIYVDLDVDVLDRVFAPACPGSRPGGLHPGEVQRAVRICGAHPKVAVLDLVEVDPTKDVADVTVLAAASFLLSFAAGVASRTVKGDT
jgi:formiminoglutamase